MFGILANSYPLLACLIRAAILHFSFHLHLFTSRCYVIGSPDSDLLYQSAGIVFLDGGRVSEELVMFSLAFHLKCLSLAQLFLLLCSYVKLSQSSQELLYSFKEKCVATHKATKTVYRCKRLTLKKYATTRSIAHFTIYNKHKHNHRYFHDTSSSLELSQWMPKLISATGSYWYGGSPVAISNFSRIFIRSFVH